MARGGRAARTAATAAAPGVKTVDSEQSSTVQPPQQQSEDALLTKAALLSLPTPSRRKASKAKDAAKDDKLEREKPEEILSPTAGNSNLPTPLSSTTVAESEGTASTSASTPIVTPTSVTSVGLRAVAEEVEELAEMRSAAEGLAAPPSQPAMAPAPTQAAPAPEKPTTPTAVPPTPPPTLPPTVAAALASCPTVPAPTTEPGSGPVKLSLGPLTLGGNPLPPPPAGPPVLPLELQSALPQPQQPGTVPAATMAPVSAMAPPARPAMMQQMQVGPAPWAAEGQQHGGLYTPGLYREMLRSKGRDAMRRSPLWSKTIAATMGQTHDAAALNSLPAAQALGLVSAPAVACAGPIQAAPQQQAPQPQMLPQQMPQMAMAPQQMAVPMQMQPVAGMQMAPQMQQQQLPQHQQPQQQMLQEQTVSLSPAMMAAPQQHFDGGAVMQQQAYAFAMPAPGQAAVCQPEQAACPVSSFITGATAGLTNQEIAEQLRAAADCQYDD